MIDSTDGGIYMNIGLLKTISDPEDGVLEVPK